MSNAHLEYQATLYDSQLSEKSGWNISTFQWVCMIQKINELTLSLVCFGDRSCMQ